MDVKLWSMEQARPAVNRGRIPIPRGFDPSSGRHGMKDRARNVPEWLEILGSIRRNWCSFSEISVFYIQNLEEK
jgi:hypothetical protein